MTVSELLLWCPKFTTHMFSHDFLRVSGGTEVTIEDHKHWDKLISISLSHNYFSRLGKPLLGLPPGHTKAGVLMTGTDGESRMDICAGIIMIVAGWIGTCRWVVGWWVGDNNANTCSVKTMSWTSVWAELGMEGTLQPSWGSVSARGEWSGTIESYSARWVFWLYVRTPAECLALGARGLKWSMKDLN